MQVDVVRHEADQLGRYHEITLKMNGKEFRILEHAMKYCPIPHNSPDYRQCLEMSCLVSTKIGELFYED